jgi:hypothetical protein
MGLVKKRRKFGTQGICLPLQREILDAHWNEKQGSVDEFKKWMSQTVRSIALGIDEAVFELRHG